MDMEVTGRGEGKAMRYEAEVVNLESNAEGMWVRLDNVRMKHGAPWRSYENAITITVPSGHKWRSAFHIGRIVDVTVRPR